MFSALTSAGTKTRGGGRSGGFDVGRNVRQGVDVFKIEDIHTHLAGFVLDWGDHLAALQFRPFKDRYINVSPSCIYLYIAYN